MFQTSIHQAIEACSSLAAAAQSSGHIEIAARARTASGTLLPDTLATATGTREIVNQFRDLLWSDRPAAEAFLPRLVDGLVTHARRFRGLNARLQSERADINFAAAVCQQQPASLLILADNAPHELAAMQAQAEQSIQQQIGLLMFASLAGPLAMVVAAPGLQQHINALCDQMRQLQISAAALNHQAGQLGQLQELCAGAADRVQAASNACVTAVQQLGQASEFSAQFGSDGLFAAVLDPILTDLLDALS